MASQVPGPASILEVLDAIASARAPMRSNLLPPAFLRLHQHDPWRRTMATLAAWNGALLLESVGSGKTWIALAVAARERGPVVVLVPAILQAQWTDAARSAGIAITTWTHERASRGALPSADPSLVIIDEAHRFRDPATRRVRTVAPWLVGRRTVLLTGTPIVNRLTDLVTLLRLALPDDALALDGIGRLGDLDACAEPPASLRRVAIRSTSNLAIAIDRRLVHLAPTEQECARGTSAVAAVRQLELSPSRATRRLLASVLLDAAASSDAAFHDALRRYRALLLQARDAGGASRAMLRRFAGESLEQTVLWSLLDPEREPAELPLPDIPRVDEMLRAQARDEHWVGAIAALCTSARPGICFTRHRATARLLRTSLGDDTAWVTGREAGIGPHRLPRHLVLAAFGMQRATWCIRRTTPHVLVATDVAAEGLDLQAAGRIVHVDLPWTATRLEQREGRLLRLGQQHPHVDVAIRMPAPALEAALLPNARLGRKGRLADKWLRSLESPDSASGDRRGGALVAMFRDDGEATDFVALCMRRDQRTGVITMSRPVDGSWCSGDFIPGVLATRAAAAVACSVGPDAIEKVLASAVRAATVRCRGDACAPQALVGRIHRLARHAAARRDADTLQRLDRLLRFVAASPTLGARALLGELLDSSDRDFLRRCVPDVARPGQLSVTVVAAILFRSCTPALRCTDVPLPDRSL